MRVPGATTVWNEYHPQILETTQTLRELSRLKDQIATFAAINHHSESPISVSVDAMAMNPDGSTLPTEGARYVFVIYGQPLDRRLKCMPLHVIEAKSGNAKKEVQEIIDQVCGILADEQMNV
jgi:alkylhydroperoxidase/carboxymuconolactone decarboxylase family protein YurZ